MRYLIECLSCHAKREVGIGKIDGHDIIDWLDNNPNPAQAKIISGRKRLDTQFGWQCICGNDDILTDQEKSFISNKQDPDNNEVANLIKNIKPQPAKFIMEKI